MRMAILQSSYIPWKGYFDLIRAVDEFILFDDVQYTRRDWRNRNTIKTRDGLKWLSIPVSVKGKYAQRIRDVVVQDGAWAERHWRTLVGSYARSPHFGRFRALFASLYERCGSEQRLSRINRTFIEQVCEILGIHTRLTDSMDYQLLDDRTERLLGLCQQAGATEYLSGP